MLLTDYKQMLHGSDGNLCGGSCKCMSSDLREMKALPSLPSSGFLLNNILSNLFIVQLNIMGSNVLNCMVVQFQILCRIETIDNNFISHRASQVQSSFSGPI